MQKQINSVGVRLVGKTNRLRLGLGIFEVSLLLARHGAFCQPNPEIAGCQAAKIGDWLRGITQTD